MAKYKLKDLSLSKLEYGSGAAACEYDGEVRYVRITDITDDGKLANDIVSPSYYEEKHILHDGDILFARTGATVGKTFLYHNSYGKCVYAGFLIRMVPDGSKVLSEYIYYFTKSPRYSDFVSMNMKVVAQPNINAKQYGDLEIDVPSFAEQYSIVEKLVKIDKLIALRKEQLAKLDQLVKSRFIELFGDCLTNPKGWKTKNLEDIAEVGSSKRVFVEELQDKGIPFYRGTEVGALAEGKEIVPELFITEEHYAELCAATGTPQSGDLLMPSICPDGRIWVVNTDEPFYFKDGRVLWVHNIDASYNPIFLLYTLKDRIMTDYSSIASGTTFAELKIFALKKCLIFDVPLVIQNEFATFIEQTDKSKLAIQQSLDKLELLKKSLMQEYFG